MWVFVYLMNIYVWEEPETAVNTLLVFELLNISYQWSDLYTYFRWNGCFHIELQIHGCCNYSECYNLLNEIVLLMSLVYSYFSSNIMSNAKKWSLKTITFNNAKKYPSSVPKSWNTKFRFGIIVVYSSFKSFYWIAKWFILALKPFTGLPIAFLI